MTTWPARHAERAHAARVPKDCWSVPLQLGGLSRAAAERSEPAPGLSRPWPRPGAPRRLHEDSSPFEQTFYHARSSEHPLELGWRITILLRLISPDGEWEEERESLRLEDITRVEFDGLYEEALSLAASTG